MEKKPMFYGGKVGPWIPVLLMLAGMLASTIIGGGGLNRLTGISFFAISVGFLLCKDKKQFGKITLKGLQNPMLGTILMAYLMAGMLAQLLRQSGLITALIWGISKLGMNAGWIPLIGFIACLLISPSCGTSTGSVAAVAPSGATPISNPSKSEVAITFRPRLCWESSISLRWASVIVCQPPHRPTMSMLSGRDFM